MSSRPPPWLRGPIRGVPATLQPVAHALVDVREEVRRAAAELPPAALRARPGGAASAAFHLFHLAGSLDRLFTYARGEALTDEQRAALGREREMEGLTLDAEVLVRRVEDTVDRAIAQLRATPKERLTEERLVGRARLPSTVLGLLFHGAEHSVRHTGQLIATAKILRNSTTK